ncbi:MAG: hypothetical protein OXQ29_28255 [Rhodospirillaceae bacterium]|nr:hypothetical protein [Rhodospirillaceae bacterium]
MQRRRRPWTRGTFRNPLQTGRTAGRAETGSASVPAAAEVLNGNPLNPFAANDMGK